MTKPAIFVYGPVACGKTHHRFEIADMFGIPHDRIVDGWPGATFWSRASLYLTNALPTALPAHSDAVLIPFSAFAFREDTRALWNGEPLTAQAKAKAEPEVEWGPPIATPGDSCPPWVTPQLMAQGRYQNKYAAWLIPHPNLVPGVANWGWPNIKAVRFPVGHPVYAERAAEAQSLLGGLGYKIEEPAPPEPDYEAYREKLALFFEAKGLDVIAARVRRGEPLNDTARDTIKGLIAAGVAP